jgi:biofilm protein TabA
MIVDRLKNAALYASDRKLARALDWLAAADLAKLQPGRVEIDGVELFALAQAYQTRLRENCRFEAHRKYIDVQYVAEGTEQMAYAHLSALKNTVPYDAEKDIEWLDGEGSFIVVPAGAFAVFFPEDAHIPGVAIGKPSAVRKVVVKVRV